MNKKGHIAWIALILVAAALAVSCELSLDRFVNYRVDEEIHDDAVYQLFPGGEPEYVDCAYADGMLSKQGPNPQLIWRVSPDKPLSDMVIRFGEPLRTSCLLKVYYDDTGEGFIQEKATPAIAMVGATEVTLPLKRAAYHALRMDFQTDMPLSEIDCAAYLVLFQKSPGYFRATRCALIFLLLAFALLLAYRCRHEESWRGAARACGEFLISDLVWAAGVSIAVSAFFSLYYHLREVGGLKDALIRALHPFWPITLITFLILYGGIYVSRQRRFSISDWLYRYRWPLGLCLLILCVLLDLNTSSLHEWAAYLGSQDKSGLLLGVSRGVRSDEWVKAIGVLKALNYERYPVYSKLIRATSTENVLIAGQVAWDISALFRPSSWGFLLLGSTAYGLSFNNFGMIIAFFLLAFDFFMLVSENRKLSFAFASALLFSPFVQWWTCYSLFISSFALLLAGHRYLTTQSLRTKLLCALCVIVFAGSFTLLLYPAWQVPVAYFLLISLIWIILENRREIRLRLKVDLPIIAGAIVFLLACGAFIYFRSAPAIYDMVNTAYPGTVRTNAPMPVDKLFVNYLNIFSPYTQQYMPGPNLSEAADFITFFPIGILLCLFAMLRNKKADLLSILLMLLSAFYAAFTYADVPLILRKITLMSFSMSQRILPWFGFVQLLLLFRGVSLMKNGLRWYIALPVSALFALGVVYGIHRSGLLAGNTLLVLPLAVLLFVLALSALFAAKSPRTLRLFATLMVFFALFTAGTVHPVQVGMAEIEQSDIVLAIRSIVEQDPEGKWLVESLSFPYGMVPLMGGAPTINCVNNYPNFDLWNKLDPEGDDDFAYNRYVSQIVTSLVRDESTVFDVGWVEDITDLRLNVDDMEAIDVSYVLTNRNLDNFSTDSVKLTQAASTGIFNIYRVEYPGRPE